jgi:hypothetical protein
MPAFPGVAQLKKASHRDTTWQEKANCKDANANVFFDPNRYTEALIVCGPCKVKEQCRESRGGADGVWGGRVYDGRKRQGGSGLRRRAS